MQVFIFFVLPIFVFNFYGIVFYTSNSELGYFLRPNKTEYMIIYASSFLGSSISSHLIRVDAKTDKIIIYEKLFNSNFLYFKRFGNNINIYTFSIYLVIENNRKKNIIYFGNIIGHQFSDQASSSNSILIGTWADTLNENWDHKYVIGLTLLKEPFNEISKTLIIEKYAETNSFKLIGLKDYFIFIRIEENIYSNYGQQFLYNGNYTYKVLDLELNLINSLTVRYTNYSNIIFSELSENNDINEFILCIIYRKYATRCQIVKYENSNLSFSKTYSVFSQHEISNKNTYYVVTINLLDEYKIGCYLLNVYSGSNDYITILYYENKTLFYYNNIKEIESPSIQKYIQSDVSKMIMTDKGIALLSCSYYTFIFYFSSICVTKNISLYPNSLLEFPIREFIFQGIDQIQFSFAEIHEFLIIYKNSTEIKIGDVFHDLNDFKYFLKIETCFKDIISIKIRNHEYDYICDINIDIIAQTNISTYKENHKCIKNKNYEKINNIIHSNLYNDNFTINNNSDLIQFEFTMEYEPKENELLFYFGNYSFQCISNYTKVICKLPSILFPKLEKLHLHSYLSCYNLIDVGWFEINDVSISNIYNLTNYNFDEISEIYDPSQKIIGYNPEMINYYYWFSCLSYCDDKKIGQKECCNNILDKWEIVFHKEYIHDKSMLDIIFDMYYLVIGRAAFEDEDDNYDYITNTIEKYAKNLGKIIKKVLDGYETIAILIPLIESLGNFVYQYNFVILKNDEYKKIVVTFPGITYYFQIIEELINEGMIELPIKSEIFNVLEMYYKIFIKLEDDLFENLASLPELMNKDYQIIFVGHSLGGAIATIASFYYNKNYNFTAENILITFGQPKVGNEKFSKELTKSLKQIYRIARPNDIATLFPFKGIDFFFQFYKILKLIIEIVKLVGNIASGNLISVGLSIFNYIRNIKDIVEEYSFLFHENSIEDYLYSHIGGLYMIDDNDNKVYHCKDFFNEKRDHFICKNHNLKLSSSFFSDFFHNRNYLTTNQDMISSCQPKKLEIFRLSLEKFNKLSRRLQISHNNNKHNYNIQRNRKLNNIQDIQESLKLFEEISFKKNNFEFLYKYESEEILKIDDLILIINPKTNRFFGEICFSQNITWLINTKLDLINCYFINIKNPFSLRVDLGKEIVDTKELYIYIKGKVSGTLELYDLKKNKTLNISSSYYIPYIDNLPSEYNINFILPKMEDNIYIKIIINDYGFTENKNISSIFEIYKDENKINYENNILMLEKDSEYNFKYLPNQYELLINFIPIYSNKFLEKQFYIINEQNISINYNIESKSNNSNFGLFFDFNGVINIKGYFSNAKENRDNFTDYILNMNEKYFISIKNEQLDYLSLNINVNSGSASELIIYDINEVIIINKINSIYEINGTKNFMILLDETIQKNFSKFESYTLISINNKNNILKLLLSNGDIVSSNNFIVSKLYDIKGIFIKANKDDIFMIKIIPEEISRYISDESNTFFGNSFIEDKKYTIEFILNNEESYIFYNSISTNVKIYELNNERSFQLEDIINNKKNNYSLFFGLKTLEKEKTHVILKESYSPFLYEKYINDLIIDFNYFLDISKICYLLMDFEYYFSYNPKIKKILIKILNNDNKQILPNIICNNEVIEIKDNIQIINVETCNGTFIMSGNNSLIYFYLPLTKNDSYTVIENEDNFELSNINQFFFIPKKNDFNSINFILTLDNISNNYPVYLTYFIEYGIIPYARNIEKKHILIKNETNINIPNYSNYSKENEKYFIFFKFNTTISKLNSKIIYENIIYLDDDQTYLILKSGVHIIKFTRDIDYYLNIKKFNKNQNNSFYSIYKNEKNFENHEISDSENIIYIQEPSYNENLKLKIENEDDILLLVSTEYFHDFSYIIYNKNIDLEQIENHLIIKFNTTNYKSKLEYNIALVDKIDNIDPISIHKKFYENDLIYKNIINSNGIEPIETSFSLESNFTYDKNYTVIAYGKDIYGRSFNFFYLEPKTLLIIDPNGTSVDNIFEGSDTITNESSITNINNEDIHNIITTITNTNEDTHNIIIEPNISTNIDEGNENNIKEPNSTSINEDVENNNATRTKKEDKKGGISTLIILFIVLVGLVFIGGIAIIFKSFPKKKNNNITEIPNQTACSENSLN